MGRPRTVGGDRQAPAISVRLRPFLMDHVERWAADGGKSRSDVARELIEEAVAGRLLAAEKAAKRKK